MSKIYKGRVSVNKMQLTKNPELEEAYKRRLILRTVQELTTEQLESLFPITKSEGAHPKDIELICSITLPNWQAKDDEA